MLRSGTATHVLSRLSSLLLTRRAALVVGILLVVVVGVGVDSARRLRDTRTHLLASRDALAGARPALAAVAGGPSTSWPTTTAVAEARTSIQRASAELANADRSLGYTRYLLPLAEIVPQARGASELPVILAIARDSAQAGEQLIAAAAPLLEPTPEESRLPMTLRARAVIMGRSGEIGDALRRLKAWVPEARRLQSREWGAWLAVVPRQLGTIAPHLDRAEGAATSFAAVSEGFDPLLGFDRPKTYLVIGQNEAEIRATGGFMGTMGLVTVTQGRVTQTTYDQVEAFEPTPGSVRHPRPPEELRQYMGAGIWLLRDTNQSPDFPTSAQIAMDFIARDKDIRVDGVIALSTITMGQLVGAFQPIDIPEYSEPLTSANWRGQVENALRTGGLTPEHTYLRPLMTRVIGLMQDTNSAQLPGLVRALSVTTASRDLQLYSTDERIQRLADAVGMSGRLSAGRDGHDVVAVVDRNMSWSKVQPGIHRDTLYLAGVGGQVDLRVTWQNRIAELNPREYPRAARYGEIWSSRTRSVTRDPGVFGSYVSVYLPDDAKNIASRGWHHESAPGLELRDGFWVLSGFVVVRPGQTTSLVVSYTLPGERQGITVWKQGGQANDRLRVLRNVGEQQSTLFDGPFIADVNLNYGAHSPRPAS